MHQLDMRLHAGQLTAVTYTESNQQTPHCLEYNGAAAPHDDAASTIMTHAQTTAWLFILL